MFFEYKRKHIEQQKVLPAFAQALSCTRLQSTSRPHSFVNTIQNGGKRRTTAPARGPSSVQDTVMVAFGCHILFLKTVV
jgi:hypothetical protein